MLHRCRTCGRIAEWHYTIARDNKGSASVSYGPAAGTKCYAPGQGAIGNEPHVLDPDMTNPVTPQSLMLPRAAKAS